mmetsp:Transcript_1196/g.2053  ORF Transcript_1196/g.2053 Transcript_1196/m.2053 type:complete len:275 (+) Transcript_1196:225-1049(+)
MSWANTKKYRANNLTCPIHPRYNLYHTQCTDQSRLRHCTCLHCNRGSALTLQKARNVLVYTQCKVWHPAFRPQNQEHTACTRLALPSRCRSPLRILCSRDFPPHTRKNLWDTSCTSNRRWCSGGTQAGRTYKTILLLRPDSFPWGTPNSWDFQSPQQSSLEGILCSATLPVRSLLLRDGTLCSWLVLSHPDTAHVDTACRLERRILQRNGLSRTPHSELRRCGSRICPVGRDSTGSLLLHPGKTHVDNPSTPACHRLGHTSRVRIQRSWLSLRR